MFTKTKVAQYIAHLAVASYTAKFANNAISDHTNIDTDGIPVKIGCAVAGEIVASHTDPYTTVIIEKAVDRYQSWKDNRNAEKE